MHKLKFAFLASLFLPSALLAQSMASTLARHPSALHTDSSIVIMSQFRTPSHATRNGALIGAAFGAVAGVVGGSFVQAACLDGGPPCHHTATIRSIELGYGALGATTFALLGAATGKIWSLAHRSSSSNELRRGD